MKTETETERNERNTLGKSNPVKLGGTMCLHLDEYARDETNMVEVVSGPDNCGSMSPTRFLKSLHDVETGGVSGRKNVSTPFTVEHIFEDGTLRTRFGSAIPQQNARIERAARTHLGDSNITETRSSFLDVEPGYHLASARLGLFDPDHVLPLNHRCGSGENGSDPTRHIIAALTGPPTAPTTAKVLIQFILRPAVSSSRRPRQNWYHGIHGTANRVERGHRGGSGWRSVLKRVREHVGIGTDHQHDLLATPSPRQRRQDAHSVATQYGRKGFHLNIRVFAVAKDSEEATDRVEGVCRAFHNSYLSPYDQTFEPTFPDGDDLRGLAVTAANRDWIDRGMVFSADTLIGIICLPTKEDTDDPRSGQQTPDLREYGGPTEARDG